MVELLIIVVLVSLFVFIDSILGWVVFFQTQTTAVENAELNKKINVLGECAVQSSASLTKAAGQSAVSFSRYRPRKKKSEMEEPQTHPLSAEPEVNGYKQL
jgi:hypothetical protein